MSRRVRYVPTPEQIAAECKKIREQWAREIKQGLRYAGNAGGTARTQGPKLEQSERLGRIVQPKRVSLEPV